MKITSPSRGALVLAAIVVLTCLPVGGARAASNVSQPVVLPFDPDTREANAGKLENLAESKGALGVYFDDVKGQYVVVVPASGGTTFSASDAADLSLPLRVETRDIDEATISQIDKALESRKPTLEQFSYGFGFDPMSGMITLASEAPESAFASIEAAFPGKISFRPGLFREAADWSNDTPPYWGGSWVNNSSGGGGSGTEHCTSGFVLDFNSGGQAMVTAGHCFTTGTATNLGTASRDSTAYPTYDFELITGRTYSGHIYDSGSTGRSVISAANPSVGSSYCTTGRTTGFRCGWTLRKLNQTICFLNTNICAHSLAEFYNANGDHVQPGDSGGPLWYSYSSPLGAGIRGIDVGWSWDLIQGFSSYATQYQTIATFYVGHAEFGA